MEHIANIYAEGELDETATCREFRQVRTEGVREVTRTLPFYNLDLIISLGYRVRSRIATAFRIWATERLREYLVKGFTMDDARLKNLGGGSYWKELLDRIRDIRSSEKVLYRQVLDLYATSIDYDPRAEASAVLVAALNAKVRSHGPRMGMAEPARQILAVVAPPVLRQQHLNRAPYNLGPRIAEQRDSGPVRPHDLASRIDKHDGAWSLFEKPMRPEIVPIDKTPHAIQG